MKIARFASVFFLVFATMSSASAQDVDQELAELRQRVDALEQQNKQLVEDMNGCIIEASEPWFAPGNASEERSYVFPEDMSAGKGTLNECPTAECLPDDCEDDEKVDDLKMFATWHHGLELETEDEAFRVHVGGRTQFDAGWFAADENVQANINNPYENGVDFRRGRLRVDGTMYSTIDWAAEYDFFGAFREGTDDRAHPAPTDLWVTFREAPWVGNIRVGNQKPAVGFEHLVSSRFLPFMERSYNQDVFYGGTFNGFWPGISFFDAYGHDDSGTWNVGVLKPTDNIFAASTHDGDYAVVNRLTWVPWYACDGAEVLHVGGSVMQRTTVEDRIIFRTRDAIRTGLSSEWPVPASTGEISGEDMQWFNGELVAVNGPWTFQSEYLINILHDAAPIIAGVVQPTVGEAVYHGGYVQVLYFLTGEHDNYNKQTGVYDRVIPRSNFYFKNGHAAGTGAWQVGARYNYLDLNDNTINGGILNNFTFGLNWFLNPNMKVQFNYMLTDRNAPLIGGLGDGVVHGWGVRLAHDF